MRGNERCSTGACRIRRVLLGLAGMVPLAALASAAVAAPPEAESILDNFVKATGGQAAYDRIQNRVVRMRVIHVGMGFEDTMIRYEARPNVNYGEIHSEALGDIRQGCNGKVFWYSSAATGSWTEDGEAGEAALEEAQFDRLAHWRQYHKSVKCEGEETVNGARCYKVVMTTNGGRTATAYFDAETGLLVKLERMRLSSRMPSTLITVAMDDYQAVDGVKIPHKVTQSFDMCGNKREMQFVLERVEHNVDLPADRFEIPADVAAQLKEAEPQTAEPNAKPAPCGAKPGAKTGAGSRPPCKTGGSDHP